MNNLEQIFKLIDAGYTKEEINELLQPKEELNKIYPEEPKEPEEPVEEAKEIPHTQNQPIAFTTDIMKQLGDAIKGLDDRINKLDKSIKAGNILNSSMEVKPTETAEDILASLITPKLRDK